NRRQRLAGPQRARSSRRLDLLDNLQIGRYARLEIQLKQHDATLLLSYDTMTDSPVNARTVFYGAGVCVTHAPPIEGATVIQPPGESRPVERVGPWRLAELHAARLPRVRRLPPLL